MKHEIVHVPPHQAGKVAAAIYGLLSVGFVPIVWLATLAAPDIDMSGIVLLLLPVIYAGFGYVFTALGCMTYNFVAKHVGGIQVEVDAVTT